MNPKSLGSNPDEQETPELSQRVALVKWSARKKRKVAALPKQAVQARPDIYPY